MLPAANKGVGMNIGFPDVCLTPAGPAVVPVPYPNMAMNAQAAPFAVTVKISMMNGLNMASAIPMTMGDEAGVAHPFFKQRGAYTMGNPVVNIEKLPAINLLCPTTGNNMNNPVGAVLVPSVTNVFFTHAASQSGGGEVPLQQVEELATAMSSAGPLRDRLLDGEIGYLPIRVFSANVPALVHTAIRRLAAAGMRGLVIDVRNNPGGDLLAFVELAGDFLDRGSEIVTVIDSDGDAVVHRARGHHPHRFPVVVMTDGRTASAAEMFAGSLQANRRALVAGEPTYGKGSVHRIVPAFGGSGATRVVMARCTLPGAHSFEGCGVRPDRLVIAAEVNSGEGDAVLSVAAALCRDLVFPH